MRNHFKPFIDYVYSNYPSDAKLVINSMIGKFNVKVTERWKSLFITDNASNAFYHYLDKNASFVYTRLINDKYYHQVFEKKKTKKLETEAPIYNMVLEQEIIELHKLTKIVKQNGGVVLDLNTDACVCVFPKGAPFKLDQAGNIEGYYYDDQKTAPKYKLEVKDARVKVPNMPGYTRTSTFE